MAANHGLGRWIFATNHKDAACSGGNGRWRERPGISFREPKLWNEQTYQDRRDDIRHLIDAIKTDSRYKNHIDWDHLGLMGHSLGGYTVLGLAGAWSSWKTEGIKAVLALSPYSEPYNIKGTLKNLSVPVMYQGGTKDLGITPTLHKNNGSYEQSPPPKYYVEFKGARHMSWTNLLSTAHESITAYSLAFMNHYLKNEATSPILTKSLPDVLSLEYDVLKN